MYCTICILQYRIQCCTIVTRTVSLAYLLSSYKRNSIFDRQQFDQHICFRNSDIWYMYVHTTFDDCHGISYGRKECFHVDKCQWLVITSLPQPEMDLNRRPCDNRTKDLATPRNPLEKIYLDDVLKNSNVNISLTPAHQWASQIKNWYHFPTIEPDLEEGCFHNQAPYLVTSHCVA